MRGTPGTHRPTQRTSGIIPAHAGNTKAIKDGRPIDGDHPRACGEHLAVALNPFLIRGSSPRMRGTRHVKEFLAQTDGIIPAHAGNTNKPP